MWQGTEAALPSPQQTPVCSAAPHIGTYSTPSLQWRAELWPGGSVQRSTPAHLPPKICIRFLLPPRRGKELLPLTRHRGCPWCLSDSQSFTALTDGEHPPFIARKAEVLIRVPQEPHKSQGRPGYLTVPRALLPSSTPGAFCNRTPLPPWTHTRKQHLLVPWPQHFPT